MGGLGLAQTFGAMACHGVGNFVTHHCGQLVVAGDEVDHAGVDRHFASRKTPSIDLAVVLDNSPIPVETGGKIGVSPLGGGHQSLHDLIHPLVVRRGLRKRARIGDSLKDFFRFQSVFPHDITQSDIFRKGKDVELGSPGPGDSGAGGEAKKGKIFSHGSAENIGLGGWYSRGLE